MSNRNFVGDFLWTMQKVRKVPAHIFFPAHQVPAKFIKRFGVFFFFLPRLPILHLSCLILSVRWVSFLPGFFFTLVANSTFVLFDLVRWLVSVSLPRVKFGDIWAIPKSGQHSIFCHIARILRPYPHPPHESNSVHAYILEAVFLFWAAQTYLVAALLCIVFRP